MTLKGTNEDGDSKRKPKKVIDPSRSLCRICRVEELETASHGSALSNPSVKARRQTGKEKSAKRKRDGDDEEDEDDAASNEDSPGKDKEGDGDDDDENVESNANGDQDEQDEDGDEASKMDVVDELRGCLVIPATSRPECLSELRNRVKDFRSKILIGRLPSWIETTTMRCCPASMIGGGLDSKEYQLLVQALLLVERQDNNEISKAFCTSIHTALMMKAQKSFGVVLLNPTDSAMNQDDSKYDKVLLALSTKTYMDLPKRRVWIRKLETML